MPSTITSLSNAIIGHLPDGKPVYEIRGGAPDPTDPPTDPPADPPADPADPPADPADDGLDDKTKATISKLRGEAAGWRTQLREAQEALGKAKTPEEFTAAVTEFEAKLAAKDEELFAERRNGVIKEHRLPKELAVLLPEKGKTIEELEAIAKNLAKYGQEDDDNEDAADGGLKPGSSSKSATDPASLAKTARGNRPRFR